MVDRSNSNCSKCGQWYMEGVEHECDPTAPLTVTVPLKKYGLSLDEIVRNLVDCDSGAGFGGRDYQMEMCSAADRRAVKEALSEYEDIEYGYFD